MNKTFVKIFPGRIVAITNKILAWLFENKLPILNFSTLNSESPGANNSQLQSLSLHHSSMHT